MLVIIPKPNKSSYDTPKTFQPIILLNTIGKLIKKIITDRQVDSITLNFIHSNQIGGIRQQSTIYAGIFITHLI